MHGACARARARACARSCAEMHDSSTWRDFDMSNSSRSSSLIDPSHMIRIRTGCKVEHPIQILIIWGRKINEISLSWSIRLNRVWVSIPRFHELSSTRVTRLYELARGESDLVVCRPGPMLLKVLSLIGARIVPWLEITPWLVPGPP